MDAVARVERGETRGRHRQIDGPIPDFAPLNPGYGLPTEAREGHQGNKNSIVSRFLRNVNELPSRKSYLNRKTYINKVHNGAGGRIGMIRATGRS
jgi:hypothetical protein